MKIQYDGIMFKLPGIFEDLDRMTNNSTVEGGGKSKKRDNIIDLLNILESEGQISNTDTTSEIQVNTDEMKSEEQAMVKAEERDEVKAEKQVEPVNIVERVSVEEISSVRETDEGMEKSIKNTLLIETDNKINTILKRNDSVNIDVNAHKLKVALSGKDKTDVFIRVKNSIDISIGGNDKVDIKIDGNKSVKVDISSDDKFSISTKGNGSISVNQTGNNTKISAEDNIDMTVHRNSKIHLSIKCGDEFNTHIIGNDNISLETDKNDNVVFDIKGNSDIDVNMTGNKQITAKFKGTKIELQNKTIVDDGIRDDEEMGRIVSDLAEDLKDLDRLGGAKEKDQIKQDVDKFIKTIGKNTDNDKIEGIVEDFIKTIKKDSDKIERDIVGDVLDSIKKNDENIKVEFGPFAFIKKVDVQNRLDELVRAIKLI